MASQRAVVPDRVAVPAVVSLDLSSLSELDVAGVRLLWINDWYDGPIEALVEYRGERLLMLVQDPDVITTNEPWRWVLFRLTTEQLAEEDRWHRLFVEHVGPHWDCTGGPHSEPSEQPARFYAPYKERTPRDPNQLEPIGWIATMPLPKASGGALVGP